VCVCVSVSVSSCLTSFKMIEVASLSHNGPTSVNHGVQKTCPEFSLYKSKNTEESRGTRKEKQKWQALRTSGKY